MMMKILLRAGREWLDLFLTILGWRQSDLGIALFHKAVRVMPDAQ